MGENASVRSLFSGVSLVGFYLFAIGFFFFIAAFLKGVQVLVFVPALFLGIFLFSRFESERIRKTVGFSLERDKDSYRIFVHSLKPVGLSFRVAFADAQGNVTFAEPDAGTMSVPYPASGAASVRLYYRGSFDLFRKVADLGPLPPESSLVSGSEALSADSYPLSKKIRAGDFVERLDAFRSSSSDVPFVKSWETSKENAAAFAPPAPKTISVRSTVPLTLPTASDKARALEWKLVALCSGIMALQWESLAFAAYLAGTFVVFFSLKNVLKVLKLPKALKTLATFACFVAMGYVSWKESDLMGPVSVFLMQILVIHFFYPDDRDESFLYIFLSLFVFATVSFLSIGVWFLVFFAVLLFLVLRLLFLSSGYLGKDSTSLPFKTEVPRKYLVNSFLALYAATFAFFAVLPHGDGYRGGVSIPTSDNSETATSGLKDDIALGGLLNVKRDPSKKLVVKSPTEEERKAFSTAYWRSERFAAFNGTGWTAEKDSSYRYLPTLSSTGGRLSLTYYDPGSKILPLPSPAASVTVGRTYRNAAFTQRVSDPTVHRSEVPMGSAYEAAVVLDRNAPPVVSYPPANVPLSPYADALFAEYWAKIPAEVAKDPLKLAKYVRDESGFEYTVDVPARSLKSFLYEEKRGHCEYFATVLAVTLRHFGFPTTVVNGYYSGEYSRLSDSWIIRGEQAHAWVELLEGGHWTVYDPTPNSGVVVKSAVQEWKAAAVSAYDYVDLVWFTYVVGYSGSAQRDLLTTLVKLWPFTLALVVFALVSVRFSRYFKERSRRSRLSYKERFLEDFGNLAGRKFPLSEMEKEHPALVRKTRRALYGTGGFGKGEYASFLKDWMEILRPGK